MTTTIYLIRHAQSLQSPKQHFSKWPLSQTGEYQAEKLCDLLEPLGIESVYSSPFDRCLQTVQPFARTFSKDVGIRHDLREQLIADEFMEGFIDVWRKCWADFNYAYPGCESCFEAQKRFVPEVMKIIEENGKKTIGISAHGAVISLFLNHIDNGFTRKNAEQLKNPDVFRVIFDGEKLMWDRGYQLPGIDNISSEVKETPVKNS